MVRVKDLRGRAEVDSQAEFVAAHGAFALIQSPPDPLLQKIAMSLQSSRTVAMAHRNRLAERLFVMLRGFEGLEVIFLPEPHQGQQFRVGRAPALEVTVNEPSVSKLHASLTFAAESRSLVLLDLGSSNGTFHNTQQLGGEPVPLQDGDTLGFGDAQFMFLNAATLYLHLRAAGR